MPRDTDTEVTGGPVGKLVGKLKQAAGKIVGDDLLTREGRLQEAQGDAAVEAAQREAQADADSERVDLQGEQLDNELERARLEIRVDEATRRDQARDEHEAAAEAERIADTIENKGS